MIRMSDSELEQLWELFRDVPIDDDDEIQEAFLEWEIGTSRFYIWQFFDQHSQGVFGLLFPNQKEQQS